MRLRVALRAFLLDFSSVVRDAIGEKLLSTFVLLVRREIRADPLPLFFIVVSVLEPSRNHLEVRSIRASFRFMSNSPLKIASTSSRSTCRSTAE